MTTPGSQGSRTGQREKLNYTVTAIEASAGLMGHGVTKVLSYLR